MRARTGNGARYERTRGARSAVHGVPHDGRGGSVSSVLPGLRHQGGESATVANESTFQQTLRGCRWAGLRERGGAASGAAIRIGGQHGASHGPTVLGAMGGGPEKAGAGSNGRG